MRAKRTSWAPLMPRRRVFVFSVSGIKAKARPTAVAMSRMERTFPVRKGVRMLLGMTESIWS